MPLRLEDKQALVAEVQAVAHAAHSVVAAEYRGLTVTQITGLRAKARESGVWLRVVKNTLARRAVSGTPYECIGPSLKGPLILAFSRTDPGAAARVVRDFARGNERLVPRFVALGGRTWPASDLERVASLPTRNEALALLLGVCKAPVVRLVRTLAEPQAKLVRTVAAVKDARVAAGG
ncbi:MAG: 50S ribosomal protein L10 [Gammaproteobacteria bacterium]|nr:50S ribosomal protein L10 [Gammaproteobacteria bacterium]